MKKEVPAKGIIRMGLGLLVFNAHAAGVDIGDKVSGTPNLSLLCDGRIKVSKEDILKSLAGVGTRENSGILFT
jgi:hypothetical protein